MRDVRGVDTSGMQTCAPHFGQFRSLRSRKTSCSSDTATGGNRERILQHHNTDYRSRCTSKRHARHARNEKEKKCGLRPLTADRAAKPGPATAVFTFSLHADGAWRPLHAFLKIPLRPRLVPAQHRDQAGCFETCRCSCRVSHRAACDSRSKTVAVAVVVNVAPLTRQRHHRTTLGFGMLSLCRGMTPSVREQ